MEILPLGVCKTDHSNTTFIHTPCRWEIPYSEAVTIFHSTMSEPARWDFPHPVFHNAGSKPATRWHFPYSVFHNAVSEPATRWDFPHSVFHSVVSESATRWDFPHSVFHSAVSEPATRWDFPHSVSIMWCQNPHQPIPFVWTYWQTNTYTHPYSEIGFPHSGDNSDVRCLSHRG